jgi:hypothetical protein
VSRVFFIFPDLHFSYMDRRQYSALVGSGLTLAISGCTGNDDGGGGDAGTGGDDNGSNETDDDPSGDSGDNRTDNSSDDDGTENETPPPEFEVTIDAPDTVETGEEWSYEVRVTNTGGAGEFRSTISTKAGETEWRDAGETIVAELGADETAVVFTSDDFSFPNRFNLKIRIDEADVTSTTEIVWGDAYDPDNIRDIASTVDYDELFRNFESYKGEPIHFEYGLVYQTLYQENREDPTTGDYYQMDVSNNTQSYEGDIGAGWFGDERLLENDYIELWGVAEELISYETVQGDTRTIPRITMTDFEIREE